MGENKRATDKKEHARAEKTRARERRDVKHMCAFFFFFRPLTSKMMLFRCSLDRE
jgi:hypothetical protein